MNIAFFDFDGTITTKDTLPQFIRFTVGNLKFIIGLIFLFPILVLYKLKLIQNYQAKQKVISFFFKEMKESVFMDAATRFSYNNIDTITRPLAIEKIQWHLQQGDKVVIVSASLECWLKPWCQKNGLALLGTKLDLQDGLVTGRLLTKNCHGIEKVNRIKEMYDLNEYNLIYVYGDSIGDREMLNLAHKKYYKPFR